MKCNVDPIIRNGNLTAAGIIFSFAISYLNNWSNIDSDWRVHDFPPLVIILLGIVSQLAALVLFLHPDSILFARFRRANMFFIFGTVATISGIIVSIGFEAFVNDCRASALVN